LAAAGPDHELQVVVRDDLVRSLVGARCAAHRLYSSNVVNPRISVDPEIGMQAAKERKKCA
jgi:hypothetical protein